MEQRFLIDSNVILDVLTRDANWYEWSRATLSDCGQSGDLVVNQIIYAELAAGFSHIEDLNAQIAGFAHVDLPWAAGFAAGQAFRQYRKRGGERRSPLPDFYIGAHAALMSFTLVTRDAGRYRTYFPSLSIVGPGDTR